MIANIRWTDGLAEALARDGRAILVVVASVQGSTPREAGAAMVVTPGRSTGTIGGGHLEFEAIRLAREALAQGRAGTWAARFPLAARLGQCCGGVATLAFAAFAGEVPAWLRTVAAHERARTPCAVVAALGEGPARLVVAGDARAGSLGAAALDDAACAAARARLAPEGGTALLPEDGTTLLVHVVRPAPFPVAVFGNGHVGRALVQVLGALPAQVAWVDTREHDFPPQVPANVDVVACDDPAAEVRGLPAGAFVVAMTHSHAQDFAIVEAALARDDFAYIGLIGSGPKRRQLAQRLAARGLPAEAMARVTCPIGASLASKEPGVIAVGVAAEMLALREAGARPVVAHAPAGDAIGARMRALPPLPPHAP